MIASAVEGRCPPNRLTLGLWILLGPFRLLDDGELFVDELFGVVAGDPPETICS